MHSIKCSSETMSGRLTTSRGTHSPSTPFKNRFTLLKTKTLKTSSVVYFHFPIFGTL